MGRISVEEQLKSVFNLDYNNLLQDLIKKDFTSDEISQYVKSKYNIEVKAATVKIHLARIKSEDRKLKKSAKTSLAEKDINYQDLLKSLCHLTKEEISENIEKDHGISIKPSTIYQYALKYGVKIATKRIRRKRSPTDLDYIETELKEDHNKSLLINKLPLPPKRFHSTKHAGFIIFKDIDAIVELCANLVIEDQSKAHVALWLKIFKDDLIEETGPIFKQKVPKEILSTIDEYNYVKICKELCSENISNLQNMTIPQLRSTLLVHCKNQKDMEKMLSHCHIAIKKVDMQ